MVWVSGLVVGGLMLSMGGEGMGSTWSFFSYGIILGLAQIWFRLVSKNIPEPYLDEVFHIPQAQLYCNGRYDYWDPKLTTPPGLYAFASLLAARDSACSVHDLRAFNAFVLILTLLFMTSVRQLIQSPKNVLNTTRDAIHTGFNMALFPPLFFFSGLFYTDLLSTCMVLMVYRFHLLRSRSGWWAIYPAGLIALTLRQTNIFWVSIFLGGLEAVRTVRSTGPQENSTNLAPKAWKERVVYELANWSSGEIHDVTIQDAGIHDFVLCALSIAVAILRQPVRILIQLLPYISLLVSFGTFVYWNGGVVLGDKSNHVATIHLPQLLYLFAFTGFFSLPLMLQPLFSFLISLHSLLRIPLFPRLIWKYVLVSAYCVGVLAITLLIIRYNTIIHPFTLADNRHYVFYVFRYTILRHPLIRYLLAPVYLTCGWIAYLTLCPNLAPPPQPRLDAPQAENPRSLSSNMETRVAKIHPPSNPSGQARTPAIERNEGVRVSFVLIFFITTALSLITAPLVEPRYFIVPWIIWRLHVPSIPSENASLLSPKRNCPEEPILSLKRLLDLASGYRLWLETVWFLAINIVTGYIFLYRGFSWPQEPGRVQRFMW